MVWAGSNLGSYEMAAEAMGQLGNVEVSIGRIRRAVDEAGQERVAEREAAVEEYRRMDLPKQQIGSSAADPPEIAVVMMDGGRYQRRDHFGKKGRPGGETHWREVKVGCLLSMRGVVFEADPMPELPEWLATGQAVAELAKLAQGQAEYESVQVCQDTTEEASGKLAFPAPKLISREVVASSVDSESFGWQLAARAWQCGFPAAGRQAFVADGAHGNWTIQETHFPQATPILDLMHALSYAYSAASAMPEKETYRRWASLIWKGRVVQVIGELEERQREIGEPPPDASPTDPRFLIHRALTYFRFHRWRMNYPEYRRLGLPLTSSPVESVIKQINRRVKGTEKFWVRETSEALLQLRADYLSDSAPMRSFWLRHQARQTGVNTYSHAQ